MIFWIFENFVKIFGKFRKFLKIVFFNLSNFASFENVLKINIQETNPNTVRTYTARGPNTHFDRPCVNQSEYRQLQGHIIKFLISSLLNSRDQTKS